jgi:short-subunit dehydrogenase
MVVLSRRIIPRMLKREKRSGIINISSIMGTMPFPRRSTYCGTKAFNDYFSRSIA